MIKKIFGSGNDFSALRAQNTKVETPYGSRLGTGEAPVLDFSSSQVFAVSVGGEDFVVTDKTHVKNINEFLNNRSAGEAEGERLDAVCAVLYKGIEPTSENLEMAHSALYGEAAVDEAVLKGAIAEEMAAEQQDSKQGTPLAEIAEKIRALFQKKALMSGGKSIYSSAAGIDELRIREISAVSDAVNSEKSFERQGALLEEMSKAAAGLQKIAEGAALKSALLTDAIHANSEDTLKPLGARHAAQLFGAARPAEAARFEALPSEVLPFEAEHTEAAQSEVPPSEAKRAGALPSAAERAGAQSAETASFGFSEISDISGGAKEAVSPDAAYALCGGERARALNDSESAHALQGDDEGAAGFGEGTKKSGAEMSTSERSELERMIDAAISGLLEGLDSVVGSFDLKTYLVSEQTELTMRAAAEFRAMQNAVLNTLKKTDPSAVKSAIETLSSAINKSTFAMMTDMKTEKALLLSIAKLEDAASALKNRDFAVAERIVKTVARELEAIDFRPSVRKIRLMAQQKLEADVDYKPEKPVQRVSSAISVFSSGTARDMLELARFTGINHEIEKYESSALSGGIKNLKEIFGDGGYSASLSGQQMLNDSDGRRRNFYMVEVPMEVGGEIGGLKVLVNGKCDENVIDWRNADLYFALRLADKEKLGVRFSINSANVKIDIYSDKQMDFSDLGEELSGIGYNLVSVRQNPLSKKAGIFAVQPDERTRLGESVSEFRRGESGFEASI